MFVFSIFGDIWKNSACKGKHYNLLSRDDDTGDNEDNQVMMKDGLQCNDPGTDRGDRLSARVCQESPA